MAAVPLARRNLFSNKSRLLRSASGIAFAVFLMLVQLGFQAAFVDSTLEVIRNFDADIVLTSSTKYQLARKAPFSRRQLYQARGVAGVASARPIYAE
jgi:putative ABC transport system permease protein